VKNILRLVAQEDLKAAHPQIQSEQALATILVRGREDIPRSSDRRQAIVAKHEFIEITVDVLAAQAVNIIIAANKEVAEPYLFEFDQILRRLRIFWYESDDLRVLDENG
jgi:hypothetical protein